MANHVSQVNPKGQVMKLLKSLVFVFACLNASVLFAQDQGDPVDQLIVKSGIKLQTEELPDVIKASIDQSLNQNQKLTAEQRAKLKDIFIQAFDPSAMLKSIKNYVSGRLSAQDLNTILTWLNSPLGVKITQLEEDASTADAFKKVREYAQGLQANPPDPNRVALLQKLDTAAHLTDNNVKMRIDMASSMAESMAPAIGNKDFSASAVNAQLEENRPKIENAARQEVIIEGLYTYQSLTDNEIQQYIDFYNSDAGMKYETVMAEGLSTSLHNVFNEAGKDLGDYLKQIAAQVAATKT